MIQDTALVDCWYKKYVSGKFVNQVIVSIQMYVLWHGYQTITKTEDKSNVLALVTNDQGAELM